MFIVGHTLIWHNQTPKWFFSNTDGKPNSPQQQKERMRKHIEAVAGRYKGKVDAWDVVNEVIDNDGSYRPTAWVNAIGDGQWKQFWSHEQTPDKQLPVVNAAPAEYTQVDYRPQKCRKLFGSYPLRTKPFRLKVLQKIFQPFIVGFAGVYAVNNALISFQKFFFLHSRYKIHGVIGVVAIELF